MTEDDPIDLRTLASAVAPDLVGPAIRRFRRRVILRAAVAATVTIIGLVAMLAVWPRQGDLRALREATGWTPKGGWDGDALDVFARGSLRGGSDWKAYTWASRKGMICWGVVVEHRRPVLGCQVEGRFGQSPRGFPGDAVLTRTETGSSDPFLPQTVLAGTVPAEIASVRLRWYDKTDGVHVHQISTYRPKEGTGRFFALVLPRDITAVKRADIEAFDEANKPVSVRSADARSDGSLTADAVRAATVAVGAGGDLRATPSAVLGPETLAEALKRVSTVRQFASRSNTLVYSVTLEGDFPPAASPRFRLRGGTYSFRVVVVEAGTGDVVAVVDPSEPD